MPGERLTSEELDGLRKFVDSEGNGAVSAAVDDLFAHIASLEASEKRLREARREDWLRAIKPATEYLYDEQPAEALRVIRERIAEVFPVNPTPLPAEQLEELRSRVTALQTEEREG